MKKIISFLLIISILAFIFEPSQVKAGGLSFGKGWAWPLLGVSVLAGFGANYLRNKAISLNDDADTLYSEYMAVPQGQPNDVFEKKYEAYEDKLAEAEGMRTYYLICLGGSILTLAGAIYLFTYKPSSKIVSFGYQTDYKNQSNDVFVKVRF
ncbi:MAG: hypothetical protein PHF84_00095 [bacterium]|nr:hypothetical protein [bacterium]